MEGGEKAEERWKTYDDNSKGGQGFGEGKRGQDRHIIHTPLQRTKVQQCAQRSTVSECDVRTFFKPYPA